MLDGACAIAAPGRAITGWVMFSVERKDFGPNFVFGTATAAYQIEGGQTDGRGSAIWDTFAKTPGNVKGADDGTTATDHYNRWPEDLDLIQVIDDPNAIVDTIFKHYEKRNFTPSHAERETFLNL